MILAALSPLRLLAQDSTKKKATDYDRISLGAGLGVDYGGLGLNFLFYPQRNFGFFACGGYALAGIGYNAGFKLRFSSKRPYPRANIYFTGMYGTNTAIIVPNNTQYNKFFYGPTLGFGIDTRHLPWKAGYWSFALLFPVRSPEVSDYRKDMEDNHKAEFSDLMPLSFSISYRLVLRKPEPRPAGL